MRRRVVTERDWALLGEAISVAESIGQRLGALRRRIETDDRERRWHYMPTPGVAACGADHPNMSKTSLSENVTCAACLLSMSPSTGTEDGHPTNMNVRAGYLCGLAHKLRLEGEDREMVLRAARSLAWAAEHLSATAAPSGTAWDESPHKADLDARVEQIIATGTERLAALAALSEPRASEAVPCAYCGRPATSRLSHPGGGITPYVCDVPECETKALAPRPNDPSPEECAELLRDGARLQDALLPRVEAMQRTPDATHCIRLTLDDGEYESSLCTACFEGFREEMRRNGLPPRNETVPSNGTERKENG